MQKLNSVKLLIIEDEYAIRNAMAIFFSDSGYEVIEASNGREGLELFQNSDPDIVFTDLRMPVMGGIEVIKAVKDINADIPIIVISGIGLIKDAVAALKLGAWDYVEKPIIDFESLKHAAEKALENSVLRNQVAELKLKLLSGSIRNPQTFSSIITCSNVLYSIFQYIEVIAPTAEPVLICGETGTGKELFANAVHVASGRNGKFVAINVAGLDDHMLSDTLFGHLKGSFTGADREREGLIARAAGGTLFLDEIGDLSDQSQIRLLRLLQEGEYFPLGSDYSRVSNARFVLATHRNLKDMVAKDKFRQDLYYRLFAHQIFIPPLRERTEDIPLLLGYFLSEAAEKLNKSRITTPPELCDHLRAYQFPGNVRELKAMAYEAVTRHTRGVLSIETFLKTMGQSCDTLLKPISSDAEIVLRTADGQRMPTLDEAEDVLIDQAMRLAKNNQGIAAGYLGINRSALNKKLMKRKIS